MHGGKLIKPGAITVIGGGLAGCEAAWQIARIGIPVRLYEMRPTRTTPAHHTDHLAELVCSNSFRSDTTANAVGLLKEELRRLHSLIFKVADETAVPAGSALAVDRLVFSRSITDAITNNKSIEVIREEAMEFPEDRPLIIATGPLTSDALAQKILELTGEDNLAFYDAIAPIIDADSIDYSRVFWASRYDRGGADYLNCPLNREEYYSFITALRKADKVPARVFEKPRYFEGCLPIEVIAERGDETLRFGAMKPVGLIDPNTGQMPYAVLQLRVENQNRTAFNMVGFQTRMTQAEQNSIFRSLPGLENACFFRYGSVHRNTFVNGPKLLKENLELKGSPGLFLSGQLTGVEGYVESTAIGFLAGLFACAQVKGFDYPVSPPPPDTALGALLRYATSGTGKENFQPSNIHFGMMPPIKANGPKRVRRQAMALRALDSLEKWSKTLNFNKTEAIRS